MNKQTALLYHLNIDEVEFENNYIEGYMRYCQDLSIRFAIPFQNVLANKSISLWYRSEFAKLENEALNICDASRADWKEKRNMYARTVARIYILHPSALLADLKDIEIINPPIPFDLN